MTRRTKKAGLSGKYGPRYGVKIRKQVNAIEGAKKRAYECPRCKHVAVRRVSTGIWQCRRCDLKFAGGAYSPNISSRAEFIKASDMEVEVVSSEAEAEEEA